MKIKNLQIMSHTTLDLDLDLTQPICLLRGCYSALALDLIRELIGDYGAENDPDRFDDGHFILLADVEMDEKNYDVCYIRNADFMGESRLATNFTPNSLDYSEEDTLEFLAKRKARNREHGNISIDLAGAPSAEDDRPIFAYVSARVPADELSSFLVTHAAAGRQVFVALPDEYPPLKATNALNAYAG